MTKGIACNPGRWITLTKSARDDFAALIIVRFKLPAFAADIHATDREPDVTQLVQGLQLHDQLIEKIARFSEAGKSCLEVHGRIDRLIVEEGPLRHQATVVFDAETVRIGGLSFAPSSAAPVGFNVYPCLSNLRLASQCRYPMLARAG